MAFLSLCAMTGLLFFTPPDSAASTDVGRTLKGLLTQDLKESPEMGGLADRLEVLRTELPGEVREILPLVLSLLRSPNPNHQSIGSMALIAIALRPDSAELLGKSIPELISLLDAHDRTHSGTALGILALLNPRPPASLVPPLLTLLADSTASTDRLLALSRTLMRAAPNDPAVVGAILSLLQWRPRMRADIVQIMGAANSVDEGAIAFLGASLADPDTNVRLMAVQAIGRQPFDVIQRFWGQLGKIAADPNEESSTREFASRALHQVRPR